MYYLWLEVLQTCERVSSPLSSLQKALFGSPDTNTRNKVPLKNKVLLHRFLYGVTELTEAVRAPALPLQWLSEAERTALHQRRTELPSQLKKAAEAAA